MKNLFRVLAVIIIGLLVLVLMINGKDLLSDLSSQKLSLDEFESTIRKEVVIEAREKPETTIYMSEGWNFIAFPFTPGFETAEGLVFDAALNGGYITTVSVWSGDRWEEYSQRGSKKYGYAFPIEAGKAYFVNNHKAFNWKLSGEELATGELNEYQLDAGWNSVGIVESQLKASGALESINQGEEKATVIDWWTQASDWELYIKRMYSPDDIREYGTDFEIKNNRGYMIFVKESTTWRLNK